MFATLTARAYRKWQLYWEQEPWGPWRDNLHAAIVAREVRRPYTKKGTSVKLEPFMVRSPDERKKEGVDGLFSMLAMAATKVKKGEVKAKPRSKKRRGKRR